MTGFDGSRSDLVVVTPPVLRDRPLPDVGSTSDKDSRGRVLVLGGSEQTPGGPLLAGTAALRAGAGKLQLATAAGPAPALAVAVPEARVVGVSDLRGSSADVDALRALLGRADAVLVGTGTLDPDDGATLLRLAASSLEDEAALVVDAGSLPALADEPELIRAVATRTVVMPNPTEAAILLDVDADELADDLASALERLVERLGCVVALRAPDTLVAGPGSPCYLDRSGHPALGSSGSGDVLAGILTGLLARGADPLDAVLWAVHLHGRAGEQAAARIGGLGVLARELVDEIPRALAAIAAQPT